MNSKKREIIKRNMGAWDGPKISEMRKRLELSQVKFAKSFDIPVKTVESWESYEKNPGNSSARRAPDYIYTMLYKIIYGKWYGG